MRALLGALALLGVGMDIGGGLGGVRVRSRGSHHQYHGIGESGINPRTRIRTSRHVRNRRRAKLLNWKGKR